MLKSLLISVLALTSSFNFISKVQTQSILNDDFEVTFDNMGQFNLYSSNINDQQWNFKWDKIVELDDNLRPLDKGVKVEFNKHFDINGFNEVVDAQNNISSTTLRWGVSTPSYEVYIDNTVYSDDYDVPYANTTIHVPYGSLKFSVAIPRWKFSSNAVALMLKMEIKHNKHQRHHEDQDHGNFTFSDDHDGPKNWDDFEEYENENEYAEWLEELESEWFEAISEYNDVSVCSDELSSIVSEFIHKIKDKVKEYNFNFSDIYDRLISHLDINISHDQCNITSRPISFTEEDDEDEDDEMDHEDEEDDIEFKVMSILDDDIDVDDDTEDDMEKVDDEIKRAKWGGNVVIDFPNRVVIDGHIVNAIIRKSGSTVRIVIPRFNRYAYYDPVTRIDNKEWMLSSSEGSENESNSYVMYILFAVFAFCILF